MINNELVSQYIEKIDMKDITLEKFGVKVKNMSHVEKRLNDDLVCFNYKYNKKKNKSPLMDLFVTDEKPEYRLLCQYKMEVRGGPVFDINTGKVVCWGMKKSFEVGKNNQYSKYYFEVLKRSASSVECTLKYDGEFLQVFMHNGNPVWKTMNTILNVKKASSYLKKYIKKIEPCCIKIMEKYNVCIMFEHVGNNRIIVDYDEEQLICIGMRKIEDGKYLLHKDLEDINAYCANFNLKIVKKCSLDDVLKTLNTVENIEGYVVKFNFDLIPPIFVKLKTKYWNDRKYDWKGKNLESVLKNLIKKKHIPKYESIFTEREKGVYEKVKDEVENHERIMAENRTKAVKKILSYVPDEFKKLSKNDVKKNRKSIYKAVGHKYGGVAIKLLLGEKPSEKSLNKLVNGGILKEEIIDREFIKKEKLIPKIMDSLINGKILKSYEIEPKVIKIVNDQFYKSPKNFDNASSSPKDLKINILEIIDENNTEKIPEVIEV
jgi:hypothetical protein